LVKIPPYDIIGCGLLIKKTKTLILSDIHLGLEDATIDRGILLPKSFFSLLEEELTLILKKAKADEIILNGDIQHSFGKVHERELFPRLLVFFKKHDVTNIAITKGNHDTLLVTHTKNIPIQDYYKRDVCFICHGDKLIKNKAYTAAKTIIIGHIHPAIKISDGVRQEKYKCYQIGHYERKELIIMPSCNPLIEGSHLNKEHSPYVHGSFSTIILGKNLETYALK
jgi:putative SbcD/Mre11-related phosphoesterase